MGAVPGAAAPGGPISRLDRSFTNP